jgi:hypothetical protein
MRRISGGVCQLGIRIAVFIARSTTSP